MPRATLVLTILVAASAALQLLFPALLPRFERNGPLVAGGELWRLVTSLFVQDGGLAWQPVGAGTSIGIFGLAGSVGVANLRGGGHPGSTVAAALAIAAALLLLLLKDIHGAAGVTGMIVAPLIGDEARPT